jgi:hypothetical protein
VSTLRWILGAFAAAVVVATPMDSHAAPEPSAPQPDVEFATDPSALVQIPVGCPNIREPADVAFVGTVLAKDEFVEKGTVRYQIDQIRAGDAAPFAVNGVIDVRYGPDSQYVDIDERYLVSAGVDANIGALASKVSPDAPLFGGDAVVGVEDNEIECPTVDDPIMTLNTNGTPVDSALLAPLTEDGRLLLSTIAVPAAIVGAVMVGLVLLRRAIDLGVKGILALGRAAVTPTGDHRAARVRRHATPMEAVELGLDAEVPEMGPPPLAFDVTAAWDREIPANDSPPDDGLDDDRLVDA